MGINMNTILGIDQSYTKCAWVFLKDNKLEDFGVISSNKNEDIFSRALFVSREIGNVYSKCVPSIVHFEGLAFNMKGNRTRDLAGLQFAIVTYMLDFDAVNFKYKIISPKSVKSFATHGQAQKIEMIDALPKNVKKKFEDKNYKKTTGLADLADAYWIAAYKDNT